MVKMSMRDKNIIDFFGIKVKCIFVNFFFVFTLVHSAFDKKFEVVTLHIKTGTCNCPCSTKKFEFQVKMPLLYIIQPSYDTLTLPLKVTPEYYKSMHDKKPDELLRDGIIELGFTASKEQINSFMTYLTELKKWNRAYNLTGLKKDEDIIIKHFFDSLLYLKVLPAGGITVADIGTGAGFPGIPLKIIRPEIEMYLIEPSRKKSAFLRHITRRLELKRIEVIEKSIQEIKVNKELPCLVDAAVTRALFSIKDFTKKASLIVKKGGTLILNKGPKFAEELKMLQNGKYEVLPVNLPFSDIKRYIVTVKVE
jgi:16S rRNA (guanine527-N7)-methyltransferase